MLTINNYSIHPKSYKYANFRFLLNRLHNIPLSKENYQAEFNNIISIAKFNHFPINKVYILNQQIENKNNLKKRTTLNNNDNKNKIYSKLTYYGLISDKIKNIFRKYNVNIAFSIHNKNAILLENKKRDSSIAGESGIYRLDCPCGNVYVGKTTRNFKKRILEHKYSFNYNLIEKSNFAAHLLHPSHNLTPFTDSYNIIKVIRDKRILDVWEVFEIYRLRHSNILINEQIPNYNNPLFEIALIFKHVYEKDKAFKYKQQMLPPVSPRIIPQLV